MALWHVVVEEEGGDAFDVVVLAWSERGARSSATRSINRSTASDVYHSTRVTSLEVNETGTVFFAPRRPDTQPFVKESV